MAQCPECGSRNVRDESWKDITRDRWIRYCCQNEDCGHCEEIIWDANRDVMSEFKKRWNT